MNAQNDERYQALSQYADEAGLAVSNLGQLLRLGEELRSSFDVLNADGYVVGFIVGIPTGFILAYDGINIDGKWHSISASWDVRGKVELTEQIAEGFSRSSQQVEHSAEIGSSEVVSKSVFQTCEYLSSVTMSVLCINPGDNPFGYKYGKTVRNGVGPSWTEYLWRACYYGSAHACPYTDQSVQVTYYCGFPPPFHGADI